MAQIEKLTMSDGRVFEIGAKVRHISRDFGGVITGIWIADRGPTGPKIRVEPDNIDEARRAGATWPLDDGGRFIQCRDAGLSPRFWETCEVLS